MAKAITLNICHLYPDLMDTYGDKGNITTIKKRCEWRGINVKYERASVNDNLSKDTDFFFFGGGQDRQQFIVAKDLLKKSSALKRSIENGAVLLSICGGYQLLQNFFKTLDGQVLKGIGIFNAHTIGSTQRMIQNLHIKIETNLASKMKSGHSELIGFENHSGKTYLSEEVRPLGKVLFGSGNNGEDKTEGAVYKNAFGCYLHGSLLPKNPHFADFLIGKALKKRYGKIKLKPLDDSIEWAAHESAVKRTRP